MKQESENRARKTARGTLRVPPASRLPLPSSRPPQGAFLGPRKPSQLNRQRQENAGSLTNRREKRFLRVCRFTGSAKNRPRRRPARAFLWRLPRFMAYGDRFPLGVVRKRFIGPSYRFICMVNRLIWKNVGPAASNIMRLARLPTNNQGHIIMKNRVHAARRFIAGAFFVMAMISPVVSADGPSSLPDTSAQPEGCRAEDMEAWSKLYYAAPMDNDDLCLFVLHRKLCELAAAG